MSTKTITVTREPDDRADKVTVRTQITDRPGGSEDFDATSEYALNGWQGYDIFAAWEAAGGGQHVVALDYLRKASESIEAETRRLVDYARQEGRSWSEIGAGLGISRQAAQQRFGS
jgi:hypothetical protein